MAGTGAYFSYYNYLDAATLSAYNSQTFSPALPLTNLQDRRVSKKARTTGALGNMFSFGADLGSSQPIKLISVIGMGVFFIGPPNASNSQSMTVIYRFSNISVGGTDVGLYSVTYSDRFPLTIVPSVHSVINGGVGFTARYVAIQVSWTTTFITFFEVGRVWIGDAMVFTGSIDEGWTQTIKDTSTIVRSRGGQIYADVRQRYRNTKIDLTLIPRISAYGDTTTLGANFQEMFSNAGTSTEVVVVPRTSVNSGVALDDYQFANHTGIYGVFASQPTLINQPGDNYKFSIDLDESL